MEKTGIKPGTKLEVQIERKMDTEPDFVLLSTFEADGEDGVFLVSAPFYKGNYFPILRGELVSFTYFTEMGRFRFQGSYREPRRQGHLHFLLFRRTSEIERTQRRDDFRLEVSLNGVMEYVELAEGGFPEPKRQKILTVDVSGGGAAVHMDRPLAPGQEVRLSLPLDPSGDETNFRAVVCWVRENPYGHAYRYCTGLRFLYEDKKVKERVIQHIFRLQQKRRKLRAGMD